ncbi:hypothetical protein [Streptomyces eurythermus]|uniref:hypothetical protein n=1 Tax=Streptomyces eurythermus TaxID=42237 RepID=UPI0036F85987
MSSHERCPYQDGRVVIDHAFKAPARFARLRELGPLHPAGFHPGLKAGWSSATTWPARR